jgi:hypothetical protein
LDEAVVQHQVSHASSSLFRQGALPDSLVFESISHHLVFSSKVWIFYGPSNSAQRRYQHSKFIFTPTWEVCEELRRRYVIVLFMNTYSLYSFN